VERVRELLLDQPKMHTSARRARKGVRAQPMAARPAIPPGLRRQPPSLPGAAAARPTRASLQAGGRVGRVAYFSRQFRSGYGLPAGARRTLTGE